MTAHKIPAPIPLHEVPPPDSDARRETHVRELVARIPAPPIGTSDRLLLEHVANRLYVVEVDFAHIRVGAQRAEDRNLAAHVALSSQIEALGGEVAGLGRHVVRRDSVSNEIQIEQAEQAARVESARRVATEAKAATAGVRVDVDELKRLASQERWAQRGKIGTAIGTVIGALEAIARLSGQDGVIGLVTKMFGGH